MIAAITALLLIFKPDRQQDLQDSEPDSTAQVQEEELPDAEQDSSMEESFILEDDTFAEPVIWISNSTGQPGRASEFRQGPASEYSIVYTCTGSPRGP